MQFEMKKMMWVGAACVLALAVQHAAIWLQNGAVLVCGVLILAALWQLVLNAGDAEQAVKDTLKKWKILQPSMQKYLLQQTEGMRHLESSLLNLQDSVPCSVQQIQLFMQSVVDQLKQLNVSAGGTYMKCTFMESRLEKMMQDGRESARHLLQIIQEYDGGICNWQLQWPLRRTIEERATWATARSRFGELCSEKAWSLIVQHAVQMCTHEVADLKASSSAEWADAAQQKRDWDEAVRLETNLKHLQKNLAEWHGAPDVQDLMSAMNALQVQFEQDKQWDGGKNAAACPRMQLAL